VDGSLCADTKLIVSWLLGARDMDAALAFTHDLESRLANRVQLTSDGHRPYLQAVEAAFSDQVDYAMLVKLYGADPQAETRYSPAKCIGARKQVIEGSVRFNENLSYGFRRNRLSRKLPYYLAKTQKNRQKLRALAVFRQRQRFFFGIGSITYILFPLSRRPAAPCTHVNASRREARN
jgi:hypothetical protein